MSVPADRNQTVQHLALRLRQLERTGKGQQRRNDLLSTGIPPLDELLPEGGIHSGALLECLSRNAGCGAGTIVWTLATQAMRQSGTCIVIDQDRSFFPPAALSFSRGMPLASDFDRLVVVHPASDNDLLWALEQSLRCCGVAVVICWIDQLHGHAYRRLQLAAETGGGVGLLLRSAEYRSQPSWADIRLQVETLPFEPQAVQKLLLSGRDAFAAGRLLRIELIHCRGRAGGHVVELEINDETGDVRLVSELAAAKDSLRATGA